MISCDTFDSFGVCNSVRGFINRETRMNRTIYHYQIKDGIPMNAVKDSLLLTA